MLSKLGFGAHGQTGILAFYLVSTLIAAAPSSTLAATSVSFAWNPSAGTNIAGYKIHYGTSSRSYTNSVAVGNVTNATISGLVGGFTYYFAATAIDLFGLESNYSSEATNPAPAIVNQPPTLNVLNDLTLNENSGLQTIPFSGVSSGASNEVQSLTVSVVSSNPSLVPTPVVNYTSPNTSGTLTFTPTPYAYGTSLVTVTVNDGGATNNTVSRAFTVTVNPVNQPPTLNSIPSLVINEDAGLQTVTLTGIGSGAANEAQTLTLNATSSNPSLIPNPTINYTSPNAVGTLAFTTVASAFGSATITVTVNDGGTSNNIVSRSFNVTVNPVNDPPTLDAIANVTLNENAGLQTIGLAGITSGAANETQVLTVTATSSNPGLVHNPTVSYTSPNATGTLTFTTVALASGIATLTVTVNDGGASNNIVTRSFTVAVNSVNQPPTLDSIPALVMN